MTVKSIANTVHTLQTFDLLLQPLLSLELFGLSERSESVQKRRRLRALGGRWRQQLSPRRSLLVRPQQTLVVLELAARLRLQRVPHLPLRALDLRCK